MANIKAAIFDMDGTLVDSLSFWPTIWKKIGKKYLGIDGYDPDPELAKRVQTMLLCDAAVYLNEACSIGADNDEFKEYICNQLNDFYKTVATVKEGAFELLEHLRAKRVKLCLATATQSEYARTAYTTLGLDKYLPVFISCTDIGKGKDQPDIYLRAIELLGGTPEETYVFEDSYVALKTAITVGIHPVGIYDKYNFHKDLESISEIYLAPDMTMRDLIKFF